MRTVVLATAIGISAVGLSIAADSQAAIRRHTDIPAQALRPALHTLSSDCDIQLVFRTDIVGDVRTNGAVGELTVAEALTQLLSGTGLSYRYLDEKTVTIVPRGGSSREDATGLAPLGGQSSSSSGGEETSDAGGEKKSFWQRLRLAQAGKPSRSEEQESAENSSERAQKRIELEEILVTGTHIRGAEVSSPLVTITQEEMRLSGHNNLGEAIRALPQNFSGGQNPGVANGAAIGGSSNNTNLTGGSSLNLRGLGVDATLTLLNGARLPYDGLAQATDVSVIPVAAIERMEVLLDGASAIYGSDAIGGVANIILKRDYDGAEVSARFGGATDGGYEQQQYTAIAGTTWRSGGFLVTGDYSYNDPVEARQRDYLGYLTNQDVMVYPQQTQRGALFSGHQQIGARAQFQLDAFYTKRSQANFGQTALSIFATDTDSLIWGAAPSVDLALAGDWSARVHGAVGRNEAERVQVVTNAVTGAQTSNSLTEYFNRTQTAGIETEGPLFGLPGGQARLSAGGGYRRNTFDRNGIDLLTGAVAGVVGAEESSQYVYGEVDLPLVSEDLGMPIMQRLSLSAALRYEDYDSFGASTTPKVGLIWGLAPGFDIRASWGRSFKVPTLLQQYQPIFLQLATGAARGAVGAPADSQVLQLVGGNPSLDPEEAEIITAGFIARPQFLPGLTVELSYFDVDFTDRVASPIDLIPQVLSNSVYADFVILNPTTAQQDAAFAVAGLPGGTLSPGSNSTGAPYDPAKVIAIVDNRFTNVSSQHVRGVDVTARYKIELSGGDLSLSGNANWITDATRKLTELAPSLPAAGVNFWPAKFKGGFGAGWSRQGLTLTAKLYHVAGISDRNVAPYAKRDSMTTMDLILDHQWDSDLLGEVGLNLAVTNLFNEQPPFLEPLFPYHVNYDSTNYSALGRVVSATMTKKF